MNGKKAKMLRKLAGPQQDTQYKDTNIRGKFMNTSAILDAHGLPVLDENGNETFNRISWRTSTVVVAAGTRQIYKVLKNIYHNRTRGLPSNMQTAGMQTS